MENGEWIISSPLTVHGLPFLQCSGATLNLFTHPFIPSREGKCGPCAFKVITNYFRKFLVRKNESTVDSCRDVASPPWRGSRGGFSATRSCCQLLNDRIAELKNLSNPNSRIVNPNFISSRLIVLRRRLITKY